MINKHQDQILENSKLSFGSGKLLIFSLNRTGCIHYSATMINKLMGLDPEVYVSSKQSGLYPKQSKILRTYFGKISFIINSILAIPLLLLFVCFKRLQYGKQMQFYFPAFHPWNYLLIRYGKWVGINSILTIHDYSIHIGESAVMKLLQNKSILLAEQLIFLSQNQRDKAIQDQPDRAGKSNIILHPILDWPILIENKLEFVNKPSILMVGSMKPYKGLDLFFESIKDIRDQFGTITIAGRIDPSLHYLKRVDVNYLDQYLSEAKIAELVSNHHILVLPYLDASQSGVAPLGIDGGTVMLVSDVGGLAEQLPEHYLGLIEATPKAFKAALLSLLTQHVFEEHKRQISEYKQQANFDFEEKLHVLF